jgi:hypothetical protein
MIEVIQEDRQYWKIIVPVEAGDLHITIMPEGMVREIVVNDEIVDVTHSWETWEEMAILKGEG